MWVISDHKKKADSVFPQQCALKHMWIQVNPSDIMWIKCYHMKKKKTKRKFNMEINESCQTVTCGINELRFLCKGGNAELFFLLNSQIKAHMSKLHSSVTYLM